MDVGHAAKRGSPPGVGAVVPLVLAIALAAVAPRGAAWAQSSRPWPGQDGHALPFHDDEEVKDFLRTAALVERRAIDVGTSGAERVTLERDGVRIDAVLRGYEHTWLLARMRDGTRYANFTDSFRFEPAAYELARLLGMDNVPPAVCRRVGARMVTLQLWVHDTRMEAERVAEGIVPPDRLRWMRQNQQVMLFDLLIGNVDRNAGNLLIDDQWKVWLIDHTRAFYARAPLDRLDAVQFVERDLWRRLRALDRESLRAALGEHLSDARIDTLLRRRDAIVERIAALIAARGADAVLYDGTG